MYTQYGTMMFGGHRMMGGVPYAAGYGGFGLLPLIGLLVLAAIVVVLAIWAIARKRSAHTAAPGAVTPSSPHAAGVDPALAIARERLARGEIDAEQYAAIAAALTGETPSAPQG